MANFGLLSCKKYRFLKKSKKFAVVFIKWLINAVLMSDCHCHLAGDSVSELPLQAGDDAGQVTWMDLDSTLPYYASHSHFLEMVAKERQAHW